ncbi:MAG: hypothetical protein J0H89_05225 [Rhizobiales bacterium]|nr:hypothetical protein [Hyphomicrobiales bacterium]
MNERTRKSRHIRADIHPFVGLTIVGLTIWLVVWAWIGFSAKGYTDFTLGVVAFFFLVAVAIPGIIIQVWRHNRPAREAPHRHSLVAWLLSDFQTWTGRVGGAQAATQILLPIAAVAFGMSGFAVVLYLTVHGVV